MITATGFANCASSRTEVQPPPGFPHRGNTKVSQAELDEAAVAACRWLWANTPEAKEWEYCGVLYLDEAGSGIRVSLPKRGRLAGRCKPTDPPPPTVLLGRYHNHRFDAVPSSFDKDIAKIRPLLSHYLCGPSGIVRRISAQEGTVNVR